MMHVFLEGVYDNIEKPAYYDSVGSSYNIVYELRMFMLITEMFSVFGKLGDLSAENEILNWLSLSN